MRDIRQWERGDFSDLRPLCFDGFPVDRVRPSSFEFQSLPILFLSARPASGKARIYYRNGWTGIVLWNGQVYFAEQILTFDAMIELVRSRFNVQDPIEREYIDAD